MYFFPISSNYRNTGVTSSYETKKTSMEKIIGLILEEVIMSDRYMLGGQMYSFLQLFLTPNKLA